ncbi:uncharacterized protein LOC119743061 [Patiria miniata]|uniref:Uncharacterized protein n=1 Tax=Patiria miniata TaxID=46514 RepID=A0A914BHI0_PATMI|nr:uncharacterized protein LOC119743061 [Patiria miniata]XP_038075332.1 uncharacterized protein LOC119743061 [Patiria miniata]
MADEVVIHVDPSESECFFTQLEEDLSGLTQQTAASVVPTPAKRKTKRKNVDSAATQSVSNRGASTSKAAGQSDLHETVANLQKTVATLAEAIAQRPTPAPRYDAFYDHDISDLTSRGNFVPERGENYENDNIVPEGGDSLCDGDLDSLLNILEEKNDDLLSEMATLVEGDDKVGPAINEKLAGTINALARGKIAPEKLEEKVKQYDKPKNCPNLSLTKVNPEIWAFFKPATRARDVKWQKVQGYIMHALTAITMTTDKLLNARNSKDQPNLDTAELIRMLVDAVAMLGAGNAQLNYRRRDLIRPDLSQKYAPLCSSQTQCTSFLFGDDLVQACKAIQETNKLGSKVHGFDTGGANRGRRRGFNRGFNRSTHYPSGDYRYYGRQQRQPFYRRGRRPYMHQSQARPTSAYVTQDTSSGKQKQSP